MNSGRREKQAAAKQTEKMIKVRINMTSKERAELKTQAMKLDSIFQIGKASLTPAMVNAVKYLYSKTVWMIRMRLHRYWQREPVQRSCR